MIPFFRKIRKKLADDNQFFRYSRYAVGEIVLVVIGILIALQINNWNEERKSRQIEYIALTELKKSIETNLLNMDTLVLNLEHRIVSTNAILKAFSENRPYHDSLSTHFAWAMVYDRLPLNTGAYESLKETGSQTINDDELRFEINYYFDYHLGILKDYIREIRDDFYNYILGYLRENFKTFILVKKIAVPKDYEALKLNETYSLSMGIFLDVQRDALRGTKEAQKRSLEILEKINIRLDKLN